MRASLSLQLSLFRSQKALISRAVAGKSAAFRAYEQRYRRRTRTYQRAIPLDEVDAQVQAADVVYVGDYHTLRVAQQSFLRMVERALEGSRRLVLALEFVEGRHQAFLDAYLQGELDERAFLDAIEHPYSGEFDIWPSFKPILELARARGLQVVAIDKRAQGARSLQLRDAFAADRVARALGATDRPRVLVLVGQFHIAPMHLPAQVEARAQGGCRSLVVYQNCEDIWWALARRGAAHRTEAVQLRKGELCLVNTSPIVCQQSFLDYLEAEAGDAPLDGGGVTARFRKMAREIAKLVGVEVRGKIEQVLVYTAADSDLIERLRTRGRMTRREVETLRKQILSRESYYVPRARLAYLASLSLNHAAEEAAHFVRHCAIGAAMDAPRRASEAFYARCVEEALGFFGSRLVNPRRRCTGLDEWAQIFATRKGEERQVAAFLLAHKAAEADGPEHAAKLIPLRQDRLFNAVSHGLGYLLGDGLHRAFEAGTLSRAEVRALFHDPLADARSVYFAAQAAARIAG